MQENVENNDKNYWNLLKSEFLEANMQGTDTSSWLGKWGSHRPRSGGSRVGFSGLGGRNRPSCITCVHDHWDLREALIEIQHNMYHQIHENMAM